MTESKLDSYRSLYEILGTAQNADTEDLKAAFRKLALVHHPDRNAGSPESQAMFILVRNAYETLIDPVRRAEYDAWLSASAALRAWKKAAPKRDAALPGSGAPAIPSPSAVAAQINYLLWDIEDLIRDRKNPAWSEKRDDRSPLKHLLLVLVRLDRTVLSPAGFPDYYLASRKLGTEIPEEQLYGIGHEAAAGGHRPFTDLNDYFYNIRKRTDQFLARLRPSDLLKEVPGTALRILDAVFDVQKLAMRHLPIAKAILEGKRGETENGALSPRSP